MDNPRFPHKVKVTRIVTIGPNSAPQEKELVILESKCRNYQNNGTAKKKLVSDVNTADFTLALPRENMLGIDVYPGDIIYVEGYLSGAVLKGIAATYGQVNNLGANIWYNKSAN